MKIKSIRSRSGFTLIEILMAVAIASAVMSMLIYMVMSSLDLRKKSIRLSTAVFLAKNLMDEISSKDDVVDTTGKFPNNAGFSYSYSMKEVEYDPFSGISTSVKSKEQETLQENRSSQSTEFSTGLVFNMNQYNVTLFYHDKLVYELECLRGLKIAQSPK